MLELPTGRDLIFLLTWAGLMFGGAAFAFSGYSAIGARTRREDPDNPFVFSDWSEMPARNRKFNLVLSYVDKYGFDANVFAMLGGCAMIVGGILFAWKVC